MADRESVLITGASSGIGAAIAREYARRGWDLLLVARRLEQLKETEAACRKIAPEIQIQLLPADVTSPDFPALLRASLAPIPRLGAVYANAGVGGAGRLEKLDVDTYRRVFEINVIGVIQTVQGALEALTESRGHLALTGSLNSYVALPLGSPYNISKFGLRGLSETLDSELAPRGIRVSLICPGPVRTEILALDNRGHCVPAAKEAFSGKPALDVDVAARRIVARVHRGKREFSLTLATSFVLWIHRHFSPLTSFAVRFFYGKFEMKFAKLVGKVNPSSV